MGLVACNKLIDWLIDWLTCHTWAPYRCVRNEALHKSTFTFTFMRLLLLQYDTINYHHMNKPTKNIFCLSQSCTTLLQQLQANVMTPQQTFDCSANPVSITIMWSAIYELAARSRGWQTVTAAAFVTAVCVSEPIRSHDNTRMCATQSMNSRGLQQTSSISVSVLQCQQDSVGMIVSAW